MFIMWKVYQFVIFNVFCYNISTVDRFVFIMNYFNAIVNIIVLMIF